MIFFKLCVLNCPYHPATAQMEMSDAFDLHAASSSRLLLLHEQTSLGNQRTICQNSLVKDLRLNDISNARINDNTKRRHRWMYCLCQILKMLIVLSSLCLVQCSWRKDFRGVVRFYASAQFSDARVENGVGAERRRYPRNFHTRLIISSFFFFFRVLF